MLQLSNGITPPFQSLNPILSFSSISAARVPKILPSFRLADGLNLWPPSGSVSFSGCFHHLHHSHRSERHPPIKARDYTP